MNGGRKKLVLWTVAIRVFAAVSATVLAGIGVVGISAQATAISQGFLTSEDDLAPGALMSFKSGSPNEVELANSQNITQLVGVVGKNTLLSLSNGNQEVQVVTGGIAPVLVSSINGDIKAGDKITASPIDGVGMKATVSTQIIGTAQTDFSQQQATEVAISDRNGEPQDVSVGLVNVQVNIMYHALKEEPTTLLPSFLRSIARAVAGHEVSALRVLLSVVALLLGFMSIAVLLYSSVRSSITSIGRNPLSETAVYKSLLEVGAITIGILLLTLLAIYLILAT